MYMPHFKIYSSVSQHLRCFYLLAVVNSAAKNMRVLGLPSWHSG